ncbi:MAG: hypothetical protein NC299_10375 [Lachnospiraceae bacterium]|nr:hypothetical protein [Ruminococcus sp.]MCM1275753.1 hypothetical protein [Lachnospiraceae bacterium]
MDENVNRYKRASTTAEAEIEAQNLTLSEVLGLITDINNTIFQNEDNKILDYFLPFSYYIIEYLKLPRFFKDEFTKMPTFEDFFSGCCAGEYDTYIRAISKTKSSRIVNEAFDIRREAFLAKTQNPLAETVGKINGALNVLTKDFENIEPGTLRKFISDFAEFAQKVNTEDVTSAMLKKAAVSSLSENKDSDTKEN